MNEFEKDIRLPAGTMEGFTDAEWLEACEDADSKEKTNKIEKVENNMDYIKCSEKELNALYNLVVAIENVESAQDSDSDVKHNLEVTNDHDLHGLAYDIKNNEIYENFIKFNKGETKVTAYDACNGTGAQIIEILHCNYDKVFGYYEDNGEKIFFVSESKESYNEENDENEIYFIVEETPVGLHECIRVDAFGGAK